MSNIQPTTIHYLEDVSKSLLNDDRPNRQQTLSAGEIRSIEEVFVNIRPRLWYLAQRLGVTLDARDDVVQESLLDAWRQLHTLRQPERFEAWLAGICRNRCLRWYQAQQKLRFNSLSEELTLEDDSGVLNIADPAIWDPAEELAQQDLATLLDRALGYLSDDARTVVKLCYLEEQPQREVAKHLGLTVNALEARLHRARRRLYQVLNTELRQDALAFGLNLSSKSDEQWRSSREWCWYCGHHRLLGTFELLGGGLVTLRMCCPTCGNLVNSGGWPSMDGLHSFRPALKRVRQAVHRHFSDLENGISICPLCKGQRPIHVLHPHELAAAFPSKERPSTDRSVLVMRCSPCAMHVEITIDRGLIHLPRVQHFIQQHPRYVIEPESSLEYQGTTALLFRLNDVTSTARLELLVHHRTLCVLKIFQM